MDFFIDTSVVVKLFIEEHESDRYLRVLQDTPSLYVSGLSWAEFHSALGRRVNQKELSSRQRDHVLDAFSKEWRTYYKIKVNEPVLALAARLVTKHSLKTLDSVQLASALEISTYLKEPVAFLTADRKLAAAAHREKLTTKI